LQVIENWKEHFRDKDVLNPGMIENIQNDGSDALLKAGDLCEGRFDAKGFAVPTLPEVWEVAKGKARKVGECFAAMFGKTFGRIKQTNKVFGEGGALSGKDLELDEEIWKQVQPELKAAWESAKLAGKSAKEFVELALKSLSVKAAPYLKRFIKEELAGGSKVAQVNPPERTASTTNTQVAMFEQDETLENPNQQELSALDEMFSASRRYRRSHEYLVLLRFITKFRQYAPFNGLLLHIQNPNVTYVASASDWKWKFNRKPKRDARPLVILQPFGPVMFLYDLPDTEGEPVPEALLNPFNTSGELPAATYERTVHNCGVHGIDVRQDLKGLFGAGKAIRLTTGTRDYYKDLGLLSSSTYLVLLNCNHGLEEKYSTLAHELGHIFCGHLGTDRLSWWDANVNSPREIEEVEAESVAYLVCMRRGLKVNSERYLSNYRTPDDIQLPFFGLNAVLLATDYIEKMGERKWKKPLKKPKAATPG
jgi:hypothetical protein